MSVMETLNTRRTYRRFAQKPVPQDVVDDMVEALRLSSCGANRQAVKLVVVQSPEMVKKVHPLVTVELRIFRGTLRYKTFMATLQFVDLLCEMAINLTDEEFQTMTWKEFAKTVSGDKAELKEYLKIRGLEE